jgi:hypothetical protein
MGPSTGPMGQQGISTPPGEPINAFVTFKISPENLQEVLFRLIELKRNPPEGVIINKIVPVAGRLDCVLDVTCASPDDHFLFVTEDLGKIKGIVSVESLVGNEYWLNYVTQARGLGTITTQSQWQQQQRFPGQLRSSAQYGFQGSRAAKYRAGYH